VWRADALTDLAEVQAVAGVVDQARASLDVALALYESKEDLTSVARTRAAAAALPRAAATA
jgi:hypothetical protein